MRDWIDAIKQQLENGDLKIYDDDEGHSELAVTSYKLRFKSGCPPGTEWADEHCCMFVCNIL